MEKILAYKFKNSSKHLLNDLKFTTQKIYIFLMQNQCLNFQLCCKQDFIVFIYVFILNECQ